MNSVKPVNIGFKLVKLARYDNEEEKCSHMETGQPTILSTFRSGGMETCHTRPSYLLVNDMCLECIIYNIGK
jgi:hypothetical protein